MSLSPLKQRSAEDSDHKDAPEQSSLISMGVEGTSSSGESILPSNVDVLDSCDRIFSSTPIYRNTSRRRLTFTSESCSPTSEAKLNGRICATDLSRLNSPIKLVADKLQEVMKISEVEASPSLQRHLGELQESISGLLAEVEVVVKSLDRQTTCHKNDLENLRQDLHNTKKELELKERANAYLEEQNQTFLEENDGLKKTNEMLLNENTKKSTQISRTEELYKKSIHIETPLENLHPNMNRLIRENSQLKEEIGILNNGLNHTSRPQETKSLGIQTEGMDKSEDGAESNLLREIEGLKEKIGILSEKNKELKLSNSFLEEKVKPLKSKSEASQPNSKEITLFREMEECDHQYVRSEELNNATQDFARNTNGPARLTEELENKNKELIHGNQSLNAKIQTLEGTKTQLEKDLVGAKQDLAKKDGEVARLTKEFEGTKKQLVEKENKVGRLNDQVTELTNEKSQLEEKLRSIQKSLDGKIEGLNGANQNVSRLNAELEEKEVQLKKLKRELTNATNEVALLNKSLDDTKKELTQEKQKTRQLNDQVTKFTEENSQLKQEKLGQKAIIDGLTRENGQLRGQVEDLQKKLDDTNQALDTKIGEVIKLTQKNSRFGEEYENTKAQLENKNQQLDETNNRLESTQAQLEKLRQDLGEKNSEVTTLTSEKSKLNDTIRKLEIQLTEKRQALDATNRHISQSKQEVSMPKQGQQQIEKVDISTQTGIWSNSDDYNQESTSENNATDLVGYSLFLKGISNRLEFYDIDQRCDTEKIADEYVEHTSSYQSEIDDSLADKSDSDWKGDRYYYISPNAYYPISPKDSALIKLDLTLTDNEKSLISEFCKELSEVATKSDRGFRDKHKGATNNPLKHIKYITDKYLLKGIRLNSECNDDKYTVMSLIFKEMRSVLDRMPECDIANDENVEIIRNIINSLLLKGGRVKRSSFYERRLLYATYGFNYEIFAELEEIDSKLKSAACEGIVNSSTQGKVLQAEVDNRHFYVKYSQDSTIEAAKVMNDPKIKNLDLRCCVFHIGESIVRVENVGEKRNYVDLTHNSDIALTFHTSEGELEVRLYPDMQNKDLIRVEVGNQALLEQLKDCNEKIGKNCLLGGLPVNQAIEQGFFVRPGKLMRSEAMSQSDEQKKGGWCERISRASNSEQTTSCAMR